MNEQINIVSRTKINRWRNKEEFHEEKWHGAESCWNLFCNFFLSRQRMKFNEVERFDDNRQRRTRVVNGWRPPVTSGRGGDPREMLPIWFDETLSRLFPEAVSNQSQSFPSSSTTSSPREFRGVFRARSRVMRPQGR